MFEHLDDGDLARQELLDVVFRRALLRDDLDGDVRLVSLGVGQLDGGVGAVTKRPHDPVAVRLEHRLTTEVVQIIVVGRLIVIRRHSRLDCTRSRVHIYTYIKLY